TTHSPRGGHRRQRAGGQASSHCKKQTPASNSFAPDQKLAKIPYRGVSAPTPKIFTAFARRPAPMLDLPHFFRMLTAIPPQPLKASKCVLFPSQFKATVKTWWLAVHFWRPH
ncbi:MAG: hypothetical protein RR758_07300, partial [Burkholderiaceae bacterium]